MSESLDIAKAVFEIVRERLARKHSLVVEVSFAFRAALTETEIYLGMLLREGQRGYDKEAGLARLWSGVAAVAATHDPDLSDSCLALSRFWANPPTKLIESHGEVLKILYSLFEKERENKKLYNFPNMH